ncbi:MAG: hypothetical protein QM743_09075 [Chitinophagaceae bacterium]
MTPAKKQLLLQFLITAVVYFVLQLLLVESDHEHPAFLKAALSAVIFAVLTGISTCFISKKFPPGPTRSGSDRKPGNV